MTSETVDPIDLSHPPPSWAVPPELRVLHGVNAAYKSQDLLQQPRLELASTGMPDQRTTCAATKAAFCTLIAQHKVRYAQDVLIRRWNRFCDQMKKKDWCDVAETKRGSWLLRIFLKPSLKMPFIFCQFGCYNTKLFVNRPISFPS